MKIQVTQEHIACGNPVDTTSCPVALAFCEAVPNCNSWSVECDKIYFGIGDTDYMIRLPEEAVSFITCFDDSALRAEARPFEFEVPELDEIRNAIEMVTR